RAARGETAGEVRPRQHRREDEERIGHVVLGLHVQPPVEDEGEDDRRDERDEDRPGRAERGLLVLDLDVAPDQEEEELAVGPELAEVQTHTPARALDAADADRRRDGAHAASLRTRWLPRTST